MTPPPSKAPVEHATTAAVHRPAPASARPAASSRTTLVFVGAACAAIGLACGWALAAARLTARAERGIGAVRSEASDTEAQLKAEEADLAAQLAAMKESLAAAERGRDQAVRERDALRTESQLQARRSPAAPPSLPPMPFEWREVARFSGDVDKETEPFQVSSPRWRLRWTCKEMPGKSGVLQLYLHKTGLRLTEGVVGKRTSVAGGDDEYTYEVRLGPGTYSLEIHSLAVEWTVVVEEG